jgi:SAM-dependent methyltransferase
MNRKLTNTIRFVMDELIPPFIRDSKIFMYPFFYLAYRGKNVKEMMNFKSRVYNYTPEKYAHLYNNLNSISRNRITDLNQASIEFILNELKDQDGNIIDIGCGSGYLLNLIGKKYPNLNRTGFDIKKGNGNENYQFVEGNLENLPFKENSFDVVICCHTIEHLLKLDVCIKELVRITKKKLIIVTPCQRYFYYTLDEHVNFFPLKEQLTHLFPFKNYNCKSLQGDWGYIGYKL